ncbi:MAG TPA: signal peptidase II [Deltaproteobacteria bacterium]|nr:signal peptidase II [Deltaproteobacteria bacterium]HCP46850.1 signal peptidase II [Deltaproteobacteria bacterium]
MPSPNTHNETGHVKLFYRRFAIFVPILVVLDQVTKYWIRETMIYGSRREVIPGFFNLTYQENRGAAWGILADAEYRLPFFVVVTIIAFVVILGYYRNLKEDEGLMAWSLLSIFAGALGNFIDRLSPRHSVTDFLDFYASGWAAPIARKIIGHNHWPSFNVADSCITIGVVLFAYHAIVLEVRTRKAAKAAPADESAAESTEPQP